MREIQSTTLLIGAKEDRIVDYLEGERAATEMPNGHWLSLPNCGHAPQIEMPRLVNRLVVHFLTSPNPSTNPVSRNSCSTSLAECLHDPAEFVR